MGKYMQETDQPPSGSDYASYEAFLEGFVDFRDGSHSNPYDAVPTATVEA
jgi:hypothetical protein